jgi:hypothetical protein
MKVDLRQLPKARLDFIAPMLARPVTELPSADHWFVKSISREKAQNAQK